MPPKAFEAASGRRQDTTRGSRSRPLGKLYRPGLTLTAVVLLWAAVNEPAQFTLTGLIVWLLTALAVGLLAWAALSLLEPAVKVGGARLLKAIRDGRDRAGEA